MLTVQQTPSQDQLAGFEFWRGLKTPEAIQTKIEEIDGYIRTLGRQIRAQWEADCPGAQMISPDCRWAEFVAAWNLFLDSWDNFRTSASSWWQRLWGDWWDEAIAYQERAIQWREAFEAMGGESAGPEIPDPRRHDIPWRGLIITGVAITGVFAGAKLLGVAQRFFAKRKQGK